jgi:hypothetical protein
MQIQLWEEAALKCAETVLQGTTHDKLSAKSDSGHKVSQKPWLKRVEERIDRATRHNGKERSIEGGVFELERGSLMPQRPAVVENEVGFRRR